MIELFYYDDVTENLFAEEDAEFTTFDEVIDELFHLNDDNSSYVGIITNEGKFKIKSYKYDSYNLYQWNEKDGTYILSDLGDFEKLEKISASYFINDEHYAPPIIDEETSLKVNKWMPPGWNEGLPVLKVLSVHGSVVSAASVRRTPTERDKCIANL